MTNFTLAGPDINALESTITALGHEISQAAFPDTEQSSTATQSKSTQSDLVLCRPETLIANSGQSRQHTIIVVAKQASIEQAVAMMKLGAAHYLDERHLSAQLANLVIELGVPPSEQSSVLDMIGNCEAINALRTQMDKVAPTHSTVLIRGESGVGKELVAKTLHARGPRANRCLVSLNCASIPEASVEAELFGSRDASGANRQGLLESAHKGTLFLDEIGELPMNAQARLLRVLQDGELRAVGDTETRRIDVRLIAATHRDLPKRIADGLFREDLFYRLNVMDLEVVPLRVRSEDIVLLAKHFLTVNAAKLNKTVLSLSAEAEQTLLGYSWPGNVRELENIIERAVILSDSSIIEPAALAITVDVKPQNTKVSESTVNLSQTSLEDYFVQFVTENEENMTETEIAAQLGISRKSLWERRQRLNIPRKRTRKRGPRQGMGRGNV